MSGGFMPERGLERAGQAVHALAVGHFVCQQFVEKLIRLVHDLQHIRGKFGLYSEFLQVSLNLVEKTLILLQTLLVWEHPPLF